MSMRVARLGSGGQRTGDGDACCPPVANETPSPAGPRLIRPYPRGRKNFLRGISGWTHKVIALASRRLPWRTGPSWRRRRRRCRYVLPVWAAVGSAPATAMRVARCRKRNAIASRPGLPRPYPRERKNFLRGISARRTSYCARAKKAQPPNGIVLVSQATAVSMPMRVVRLGSVPATAMPMRVVRLGNGGHRTSDVDTCCPPVANKTPSPLNPRLLRLYPRGRKNFLHGVLCQLHKVFAPSCRRLRRQIGSSWCPWLHRGVLSAACCRYVLPAARFTATCCRYVLSAACKRNAPSTRPHAIATLAPSPRQPSPKPRRSELILAGAKTFCMGFF